MRCDGVPQSPISWHFSRAMPRLAVAALFATLAAGCSSDALRFSDSPFSNPFASKSADATPPVPAVPTSKVQSRQLGVPQRQASLAQPDTDIVTGSIKLRATSPAPNKSISLGNWTTTGGTSLEVHEGDTISVLSSRYGVPENALRLANNIRPGTNPAPGSHIIMPVYRYGPPIGVTSPGKVASSGAQELTTRKVEATRLSAKREEEDNKKSALAAKRSAGAAKVATKPDPEPQRIASKPGVEPQAVKTASINPAQALPAKVAPEDVDPSLATGAVKGDSPQFRWPARGRVISRFGDGNDGINVAVPEGTSVRAAEDGTVAYVGDEIKGYGKLVLLRHANGWVTAYANNGDLLVKKGEAVKRGQVLAKSGQTGNVTSPQLHFELRKGKTPVDPTQYLAGG
jgi:murein DD-endopeptidase MepM/ murein hydrolase activator NlpD